jgi:hypothetical protein
MVIGTEIAGAGGGFPAIGGNGQGMARCAVRAAQRRNSSYDTLKISFRPLNADGDPATAGRRLYHFLTSQN